MKMHKFSERNLELPQCNRAVKLLKISIGKSSLIDFPWSWSMRYMMKLGISLPMIGGLELDDL